MRVALVSTFPPARCGIAKYTANLRAALRERGDVDVTVLAERLAADEATEPQIHRAWHRRDDWVSTILAAVDEVEPHVVHFQHEEAILGQNRQLPRLLEGLRQRRIGSVVTLHSVFSKGRGWLPGRWPAVTFQKALGSAVDRLVVHHRTGCRDPLLGQGVPNEKVHVIAHGTALEPLPSRERARAALGIGNDERVALSLGFIHFRKGTHTLLSAMRRVVDRVPGSRLIVAGMPRSRHPVDWAYRLLLRWRRRHGLRAGWLDYRPSFHSVEDVRNFLAAADVVALPYRQSYGSASGILHTALGGGCPVVCANGLKFAEALDHWGADIPDLFPRPGHVAQWADALIRVLSDDALREEMAVRSRALGEATSWCKVAQRHVEVYREAARVAGAALSDARAIANSA